MGGEIRVESDEGRGAKFIVEIGIGWGRTIERAEEVTDAETSSFVDGSVAYVNSNSGGRNSGELTDATAGPRRERGEREYDFRGKYVLLAEDIEVNRKLVSLFLEETGVTIDCAENGAQAVEMYTANPGKYKVILMDVQMPVLDGLSATRKIRASGLADAKSIPIIAMTANAFKEDEELSIEAGMNGHIIKPIDIPELLKRLAEVMG
jgi:CheY-like chemotaxis protein